MYRAAVIGLGWMGLLYDLAARIGDRFEIDDIDRPTPPLDIHRKFHHYDHPGDEGNPTSYAEAFWDRPEVATVIAADRDANRLEAFGERYGTTALYQDAEEMLRRERPDLVAVCTNTKHRAHLTEVAVACGARGILTEKPMAHTLEEVDRMVGACGEAQVPLCCGAITTTHPSFGRAKALLADGAIGPLVSIEAAGACAQHQNWSYFLDAAPAWVVGAGTLARRESGSDEFAGQGMLVAEDGLAVHFRAGAPGVRLRAESGEMVFDFARGWRLWREVKGGEGMSMAEVDWPRPQFNVPYGAVYCVDDVMRCLGGELDEPKNSGRRVGVALEVEVALKESVKRGGEKVELPLADRGLGLNYDWFR